jgi:D-sedoheptulose 7-phosphate isomerase
VNPLREAVLASLRAKQSLLDEEWLLDRCQTTADLLADAYRADRKVLFCGNGGSAADAQHLAAELSGKYGFDRPPLYAEALHVNTSYLTAVANDYGYNFVFERMLRAAGRPGDVLVCLTTSGNSMNVLLAAKEARRIGMTVVSFTGRGGGKLAELSDILLDMPSTETPRIQECHMLLGHTICGMVEQQIFGADYGPRIVEQELLAMALPPVPID